jgi:hypothetical protein
VRPVAWRRHVDRRDLLVALAGLHVSGIDREDGSGALMVTAQSEQGVMGCHTCGVVARADGRRECARSTHGWRASGGLLPAC